MSRNITSMQYDTESYNLPRHVDVKKEHLSFKEARAEKQLLLEVAPPNTDVSVNNLITEEAGHGFLSVSATERGRTPRAHTRLTPTPLSFTVPSGDKAGATVPHAAASTAKQVLFVAEIHVKNSFRARFFGRAAVRPKAARAVRLSDVRSLP